LSRLVPDQGLLKFFTAIVRIGWLQRAIPEKGNFCERPADAGDDPKPANAAESQSAGGHSNQTLLAGGSCASAARVSSLPRLKASTRGKAGTQEFLRSG
jgi:hypothetical protein